MTVMASHAAAIGGQEGDWMRVVDIPGTIGMLAKGKATPEQQVEIACFLFILKDLGDWEKAEDIHLLMMSTGMIAKKQ